MKGEVRCSSFCVLLLLAVGLAGGGAPARAEAAAEAPFEHDPRVVEAEGLLEDRSDWPQAIALLEAVLADEPDHRRARLWLARVRAWKGDYDPALLQFDLMISDTGRDPDEIWLLRTERAEVLSWAGRYPEALAGFRGLIAERPRDPRATLGLARTLRWSGRPGEALASYQQSLELREDEEARQEFEQAQIEARTATAASAGETRASLETSQAGDSDHFQLQVVAIGTELDVGHDTKVTGSVSYRHLDFEWLSATTTFIPPRFSTDEGAAVAIGLETLLAPKLRASIKGGYLQWERSPDHGLVSGTLEYTLTDATALGAEIRWDDLLETSSAGAAVAAGIEITNLHVWAWQQITPQISGYASLDYGLLSDANNAGEANDWNQRIAVGLSGDWQPWSEHQVWLGAALDYVSFAHPSERYYDPTFDLAAQIFVRGKYQLAPILSLEAEFGLGAGSAKQDSNSETGLNWRVQGGPTLEFGRWSLSARGAYSESQRSSTYSHYRVGLHVIRGF